MGLEALAFGAATGLGVFGQIQAGQAAEVQAESARNIAEYNAAVARQEAKAIEQRTAIEQKQQAEEAARVQSALEAGLGASGAVTTAGAPLMLQAKQASESELENLMIGYRGRVKAGRARSQAKLDVMEGKVAEQRGKATARGKYIGAGATLLTGFTTGRERGYF